MLLYGATARALGGAGEGGFIEISGRETLFYDGLADASAVSGQRGNVLFDPGTVAVGGAGSTMTIASINSTLDTNTNVTIATHSGDVIFENIGSGDSRDVAVQWNTDASLGVFASGDVRFLSHARTAGAGSVNVIAGWDGDEGDLQISDNDPEAAWNYYVTNGLFGIDDGDPLTGTGNIYVNDSANDKSVEVGSRYGSTNVAGYNVEIAGAVGGQRHAQLGYRDNGQAFYYNTTALNGSADAAVERVHDQHHRRRSELSERARERVRDGPAAAGAGWVRVLLRHAGVGGPTGGGGTRRRIEWRRRWRRWCDRRRHERIAVGVLAKPVPRRPVD